MYKQYDMYVVNGKCKPNDKNKQSCEKCTLIQCNSVDIDINRGDSDVRLDIILKPTKNTSEGI